VGDSGAVEVILTQKYARSFSALFSKDVVTENVRAVATSVNDGNFCVLALNKSVANAIWFQGSSYSNLGCGIASNSSSASSISANGSSQAYVTTARTTGGPSTSGLSCITTAQVNVILNSPTLPHELSPGFYCAGLSIGSNKTATLKPGVYIVAGGNFDINANATVKGDGVTIILTNTNGGPYAQVTMNGTATIQLTAPTSGPWQNVLFYQDRMAPMSINSPNKINGNSSSKFKGVMYFPSTSLQLDGNATVVDSCLQVVAQTVTFIGNFTLPTACADPTFKKISGVQVSLVE
jgi:hypothetical protein